MDKILIYLVKEEWEQGKTPNLSSSVFSDFKNILPSEHCVAITVSKVAVRVNKLSLTLTPAQIHKIFITNPNLEFATSRNRVSLSLQLLKACFLTLFGK